MNCPSKASHTIDVPPKFSQITDYVGSLGHKINHSFQPNSEFVNFDTPRYGLVRALKTTVNVSEGDEFFADYAYDIHSMAQPLWYRDLYREELEKDSPDVKFKINREEDLQILDAIEQQISNLEVNELYIKKQ